MQLIAFVFLLLAFIVVPAAMGRYILSEPLERPFDCAIAWLVGFAIIVIVMGLIGVTYSIVYLG